MAASALLEERVDFQVSGASVSVIQAPTLIQAPAEQAGSLRAMYSRLARQYDARPRVPDFGGGLPGELNPD